MYEFLIGLFVFINLAIRLPVRIALKFRPESEILGKIDITFLVVAGFNMGAMAIYYGAMTGDVISTIVLLLFLVGIPSLIFYLIRKSNKDFKKWQVARKDKSVIEEITEWRFSYWIDGRPKKEWKTEVTEEEAYIIAGALARKESLDDNAELESLRQRVCAEIEMHHSSCEGLIVRFQVSEDEE